MEAGPYILPNVEETKHSFEFPQYKLSQFRTKLISYNALQWTIPSQDICISPPDQK